MSVTISRNANGVVALVEGEFTINTVEDLKDDFFVLLNSPEATLDLSQVTEFDGSALQLLAIFVAEVARMEHTLHLVPEDAPLLRTLRRMGFGPEGFFSLEGEHGSV